MSKNWGTVHKIDSPPRIEEDPFAACDVINDALHRLAARHCAKNMEDVNRIVAFLNDRIEGLTPFIRDQIEICVIVRSLFEPATDFVEKMTPFQLKAARELLALSQSEICNLLSFSRPSWADMEQGKFSVNPNVQKAVQDLLHKRKLMLWEQLDILQTKNYSAAVYYTDENDCGGKLDLKLHQSVARSLSFEHGYGLVAFDKQKYDEFCEKEGFEDKISTRLYWAHITHSMKIKRIDVCSE